MRYIAIVSKFTIVAVLLTGAPFALAGKAIPGCTITCECDPVPSSGASNVSVYCTAHEEQPGAPYSCSPIVDADKGCKGVTCTSLEAGQPVTSELECPDPQP
jgi:hypothetical protein